MKKLLILSTAILLTSFLYSREEIDFLDYFGKESLLRERCQNIQKAWINSRSKDEAETKCNIIRIYLRQTFNNEFEVIEHATKILKKAPTVLDHQQETFSPEVPVPFEAPMIKLIRSLLDGVSDEEINRELMRFFTSYVAVKKAGREARENDQKLLNQLRKIAFEQEKSQ